jgi:hypothetical protein
VLVAARYAGKTDRRVRAGARVRAFDAQGFAPVPHADADVRVALILVHDMSALFPGLGSTLASVVVSAIVMLEVLGPAAAYFALVRAGETDETARR